MSIVNQTKKTMSTCISNFAKEYDKNNLEVQLLIKSDYEFIPSYYLLINNKNEKQITFNEILNVKIDFLGREMRGKPFISNTLRKLSKEQNCSPSEMNILIYNRNKKEDVSLYFFIDTKPIKAISFDYIFEELSM